MCEYKIRYLHLHVLWIILSYLGVFSIAFTTSSQVIKNNIFDIKSHKYDLNAGDIVVATVAEISATVRCFLLSVTIVIIANTTNWLKYRSKCCCIFIHEKLEIFIGSVSSASSVVFKGNADLDKYWSTDQSTDD